MSEPKAWIEESHPEHAAETAASPSIRERLRELTDTAAGRFTIGQAARKTGWSPSVISQYLAGKYPGDNAKVERSLCDWFDAIERERQIGVAPVRSEATEQMAEALELIRSTNDAGVLFGDAGIGKSTGIALYMEDHPTSILITMSRWNRDQGSIERRLMEVLGKGDRKATETRGEYIVRRLTGSSRLIIVDNAHKATRPALEWLIDCHDATGCPLALVGNEEVTGKIDDNAQRHSRMLYRRRIDGMTRAKDKKPVFNPRPLIRHIAREIVPDWPLGEVERHVEAVTESDGRFRNVTKLLKLGREFERKLGGGLEVKTYLELAAERQCCRGVVS